MTSSLVSRMQPEVAAVPMVCGSFDPWMRYIVSPRYMARAPSGLAGPPCIWCGRSGRRRRPIRPFPLVGDGRYSRPGESFAPDADTVSHRLALAQNQIQPPFMRVHNDGARLVFVRIVHDLSWHRREHGKEIRHRVNAGIGIGTGTKEQGGGADRPSQEPRSHGNAPVFGLS